MSKPSSKAAKHSAASHKKKGETPELHGGRGDVSPTGSLPSEAGGEGEGARGEGTTVHPLDEVIGGEEVEVLRITEDKLSKLLPPLLSPTPSPTPTQPAGCPKRVMVRKARASEDTHSKKKRVAVLRPLPSGASVGASTTRTLELGARRGGRESLSPYRVLGSTEENTQGLSEELPLKSHTAPLSHDPTSPPHTFSYRDTIVPRERHALQYWEEAMGDRKSQQHYLAKKLQTSPERLAMNQGDGYRQVQEERTQIDRAIPPLDYGKGYRVGSEFWSQSVPIGDTETGINTTLTRSEKGQPLPLELVGIPSSVRREKGMQSAERNAPLHYTWQTTPYLISRTQQLHPPTLADTPQTVKPDMDELEVIGHAIHCPPGPQGGQFEEALGEEEEEESYSEDSLSSNDENPPPNQVRSLNQIPDTFSHPLMGPALTIGGHLLKWEGAPPRAGTGSTGLEPVRLRVTFESGVEEEVTSCLDMVNSGTTAIYYSWKHLVQPNPLGVVQAGETQRFYFDTRGGVLLPGQQFSFPFVFKSPGAGIFSETWALQTGPVLAGGRGITITLRGVAFQEDTNAHRRDELERELDHRVAMVAAERLIQQIVDSIATPPHGSPLLLATPTEEDTFRTQNPHLFYHYNTVQQLKTLYDSILRPELLEDQPASDTGHTPTPGKKGEKGKPVGGGGGGKKEKGGSGGQERKAVKEAVTAEAADEPGEKVTSTVPDWDLSIDSLVQVVMGIEEDETREGKLKLLSDLLGELSFPPLTLPSISPYTLVYQLVGEAMEQVSASSQHLCRVMGLPQRESCPLKPSSVEDDQLSSTPSSAAMVNKKEKEKKGKKQDSKKGGAAKDKDRAPSRSKGVTGRKSKTSVTSKEAEPPEAPAVDQQSVPQPEQQQQQGHQKVDPVLERNYRENFHTVVYGILVGIVDKMIMMLP